MKRKEKKRNEKKRKEKKTKIKKRTFRKSYEKLQLAPGMTLEYV